MKQTHKFPQPHIHICSDVNKQLGFVVPAVYTHASSISSVRDDDVAVPSLLTSQFNLDLHNPRGNFHGGALVEQTSTGDRVKDSDSKFRRSADKNSASCHHYLYMKRPYWILQSRPKLETFQVENTTLDCPVFLNNIKLIIKTINTNYSVQMTYL